VVREKIEEFGMIFRFLTPILIGIVGWITIQYLSSIDHKFNSIDNKFSDFIESYHAVDKRIDKLEYKVFGQ
jgi:hypothetical protein